LVSLPGKGPIPPGQALRKVKGSKYNFKKHLHSTIKSENAEVLGGLRATPNEIKPNPVDQPERTAHYNCAMCMLHNIIAETVLLIFPFLQTNITVQMRPSGG